MDASVGLACVALMVGIAGIVACLADPDLPSGSGMFMRILRLLGRASFSLYLLHLPLLLIFLAILPLEEKWFLLVYLPAALALAIVAHLAIEIPARKAILNRFR